MADEKTEPTVAEAKVPTQTFIAKFNVHAASGKAEVGKPIALTRAEYDELIDTGAIEGEWKDKPSK